MQFFPEANEVTFARKSVFGGSSLKLDYLTKPSFFEDFGFVTKVKMADRVKPEDELFLVAYPYFNVNGSYSDSSPPNLILNIFPLIIIYHAEMLVVEELYKEAVANTSRQLIIFNGELDRIRSGCILFFFLNFVYLYFMSELSKRFPTTHFFFIFKIIRRFSIRNWLLFPSHCYRRWRLFITFTTLKVEMEVYSSGN